MILSTDGRTDGQCEIITPFNFIEEEGIKMLCPEIAFENVVCKMVAISLKIQGGKTSW